MVGKVAGNRPAVLVKVVRNVAYLKENPPPRYQVAGHSTAFLLDSEVPPACGAAQSAMRN